MNTNSTGVKIPKKDFFRLPADQRQMSEAGPMVKTTIGGQPVFVPAIII